MRSRRTFLRALGGGTVLVAGCLDGGVRGGDAGEQEGPDEPNTPRGPFELGESVTAGNCELVVSEVELVEDVAETGPYATAANGVYVIAQVHVENVSETAITLPFGADIVLVYEKEARSKLPVGTDFVVDGEAYVTYGGEFRGKTDNEEAPPGTVIDGWTLFTGGREIGKRLHGFEEPFDNTDAFVSVTYDGGSEGPQRFRWKTY